jgi:ribosome maturation factor RimP
MVEMDMLVRTLAPAVAGLGLELYDVEVSGSGRARILRVLIDRDGGIDLDAVADATEAISPLLDAPPLDAVIAGPYALEVSSPGLERPLRTPAHYRRAVGDTVSIKIRAADDQGGRRVRGVVVAADDAGFDLTLDDGTSEHHGYGDVTQARTVFEWGSNPKPAKAKKASSPRASSPKEVVTR